MIRSTFRAALFAALIVSVTAWSEQSRAASNPRQVVCQNVGLTIAQTVTGMRNVARKYNVRPQPEDIQTAINGIIARNTEKWRAQGLNDEGIYRYINLLQQGAQDVKENFATHTNVSEAQSRILIEANCYNHYHF